MAKTLDEFNISQIGIVVRDLERVKKNMAAFLGVDVPPSKTSGEYAVTQTVYRGEPAPEAACQMAFFDFGNLQVEFLQPNEAPSVWREFLEETGEGIHHLAFQVQGAKKHIESLEAFGLPVVQKGEYREGNGCYAYFDARDMFGMYFELLETYEK